MVDIVTRLGKGSPLTNAEVDANFTNLAEVSGVTGEPMGHEDRTTSTISFNASTRTFTIAPVASSFTVWCKGKKVVVSTAQTVTIPNTTGMYSIYYDANGVLSAKSGYFTFSLEAPTAYVYWNAATGTAPYFGDERHGVVLDWQTHEYLHRTRGAALASGFSASGYVLGGNGSSNSHAQITLEGGTFFDEDMKIIVTATNTPTAGTWEQDLLSPARIPVLYLSGTGWVIDAPTDYPLKQGTARPQYNAYSGGVWSTADVANNKYATSWILATNNLTYPVIAIIGQAENDLQSAAEAVDFTALQLPGFPSVEFRPLYKLIFQCADSCTNAVHASLVSITDIRSIAAAGTAASIVTDHGNLSGLSDDDHPQYIHVDTLRTVSAAVKASFLPSQTSNAGKFLQTDGTATSWQALTSGNVTTALGFTPYNATNPSGYISGITSGMVTTALGFTPYNATNPSGYVTAAGARGAISVTGAGSYDSATGVINIVGGVTSFNTRTGAITLSSADVTTALGFTPYNNTNPSGYITGITSTMVTTALGYTPYNSSNPNGYISSITSANVTTALGFTPYNATNPSGYITSSALSGYLTSASAASTYLALTGDATRSGTTTLSGVTIFNNYISLTGDFYHNGSQYILNAAQNGWINIVSRNGGNPFINNVTYNGSTILHAGNYSSYALPLSGGTMTGTLGLHSTTGTNGFYNGTGDGANFSTYNFLLRGWNGMAFENPTSGGAYPNQVSGVVDFRNGIINMKGGFQTNGSTVLHAGNYTSYSLPVTGGTFTGNVTLDTGNGEIVVSPTGWRSSDRAAIKIRSKANTPAEIDLRHTVGGVESGWHISARDTSAESELHLYRFNMTSAGAVDAAGSFLQMFTFKANGGFNSAGAITQGGNQVLHAGNYSSYALPLSGGSLSGALNVSRRRLSFSSAYNDANHSIYNNYENIDGEGVWDGMKMNVYAGLRVRVGNAGGAVPSLSFAVYDGQGVHIPGSFTMGSRANASTYGGNTSGMSGHAFPAEIRANAAKPTLTWHYESVATRHIALDADGALNVYNPGESGGAVFKVGGNTALHAGNYSSYALPLGGGTVTGDLLVQGGSSRFPSHFFHYEYDAAGNIYEHYYAPGSENVKNSAANIRVSSTSGYYKTLRFSGDGSFSWNGSEVLRASNYSSYALPLSGGTVTGTTAFTRTDDNAISVGTIRGRAVGSESGDFVHIYERVHIGSPAGWGSRSAPTYGLSTYGGCALATDTGSVTIGGNAALHAGNYTSYTLPLGGGWYGSGLPGSRWNGLSVSGGEIVFGNGLPNAGQMGILVDGCYVAGENNGFWSMANDNTWGSRRGMYWDGSYLNFTTNTPTARFQSILTDGNVSFGGAVNVNSRDIRYFENDSFKEFYVGGDANTYYPVRFDVSSWFHFARWSISRGYGDTAPWDPIGTGAHKGGLTLTWEWSGDGAWGGNDKTIRVIQFAESYTTMVGGMALSVNGFIVWLRGGNAYYRFHGPGGTMNSATPYYSTFTASNGSTYSPRSYDSGTVGAEVTNRMPVRGSHELYDTGNRVLHAGNYGSYALPLGGGTILGRVTFQDSSDTQITLNGNGTNWTGITATDAGGTDYLWIYGATGTWTFGGGGSPISGKKMHIHGGVTIGSGYAQTSNPTNGLSVQGEILTPTITAGGLGRSASNTIGANLGSGAISWNNAQLEIKNSDAGSVGIAFHRAGYTSNAIYANDGNGLRLDGNIILHAGNYGSYALPLSGGTISGNQTITGSLTVSSGNTTGNGIILADDGDIVDLNDAYCSMRFSYGVRVFSANRGGSAVHTLHSNGTFTASGNITAYSDERLKTDWAPVATDFIERLAKVKSGTYTRIDNNKRQAGSSAQDWQQLLPEVVTETDNEEKTLSMAYGNAALVSAVELAKEVVDLRNRVAQLESLINKLIGD